MIWLPTIEFKSILFFINCTCLLLLHRTLDDDFYRSLAANAPEVSDVSDADPNEMAQGLDVS